MHAIKITTNNLRSDLDFICDKLERNGCLSYSI